MLLCICCIGNARLGPMFAPHYRLSETQGSRGALAHGAHSVRPDFPCLAQGSAPAPGMAKGRGRFVRLGSVQSAY